MFMAGGTAYWSRRTNWNKGLSESTRPNLTALLTMSMPSRGRNMYRTASMPIMIPKWTPDPFSPGKNSIFCSEKTMLVMHIWLNFLVIKRISVPRRRFAPNIKITHGTAASLHIEGSVVKSLMLQQYHHHMTMYSMQQDNTFRPSDLFVCCDRSEEKTSS